MERVVAEPAVDVVRRLRAAGVPVGVDQTERFADALRWIDPTDPRQLYLAARATLVHRREDLALFDRLCGLGPPPAPRPPRPDPVASTALVSFMAQRARADDPEVEVPEAHKAASPLEQLRRKDFGRMTDEEREALRRVMAELRFAPALRRTRRRVVAARGDQVDLRRALREYARRGAILRVPRRARKWKRRPIVVLADVSGSMEPYARVLLLFLHGLTHGLGDVETFVFGTRLTRVTSELRLGHVDRAIAEATARIVDYGGGTRIAECVDRFLREHGGRALRRGAVVLVVSDGWETGDPDALGAAVARLRGRAHRLVWLNPLLGGRRYEARARGMAAALPHVDDFLPVHDLHSLTRLAGHLARLPARRSR